MKKIFLYLILLVVVACSNSSKDNTITSGVSNEATTVESKPNISSEDEDANNEFAEFKDDTYSAEVEYYNPNTGRTSYYTLDVEVVDNIVSVIHFSNGGWLDETHIIRGGELDENGTTIIESDKGYYYTVTISR